MFHPYSHSKIALLKKCKRAFAFKYYLKLKPKNFGITPYVWPTTQLGIDSHKVMELAVQKVKAGLTFKLSELISAVTSQDILRKSNILPYKAGIKRYIMELMPLIKSADIYVESTFVRTIDDVDTHKLYLKPWEPYMDTSNKFIAIPDLVINTLDDIYIIDYKTKQGLDESYPWKDAYLQQLYEYAPVVQNALGKDKNVVLHLTNLCTGEPIVRKISKELMPAYNTELNEAIPNITEKDISFEKPSDLEDACKFCEWKGHCDEVYSKIS